MRAIKLTLIVALALGALTWGVFYDDSTTVSDGKVLAGNGGDESSGTAYEMDSNGRPHALGPTSQVSPNEERVEQVDYAERAAAAMVNGDAQYNEPVQGAPTNSD